MCDWLVRGGVAMLVTATPGVASAVDRPFAITVRDADSGAPVPCVTVRTVHGITLRSDASGLIAFYEPGLMDRDVYFGTLGPPWELATDWIGFTGAVLAVTEGGSGTLTVRRTETPGPCDADTRDTDLIAVGLPAVEERHGIRVRDAETGRGVPLVELRSGVGTWMTDSAGWAAVIEPEFLGGTHPITASSHGFAPTAAPITIDLARGGRSELALRRRLPAERLYRVTGAGIYRDSVLLGEPTPLAEPLLNAQVAGMDSTHTALHHGRLFWIWGDTLRPSYPLGHFKTAGATSMLPTDGGLDPSLGVDLTYFAGADGFSRGIADVSDEGLVWTSGLVSIPGANDGADALIGSYANVGANWERLGAGLLLWDEAAEAFEVLVDWPEALPAEPTGTAFVEGDFVYFTDIGGDEGGGAPYRVVRVPATLDALRDPATYETFTARGADGEVMRTGDQPSYAWRASAPPVTVSTPAVAPEFVLSQHLHDPLTGEAVGDHIGSVFWNEHLGRYLRIAARPFGDDAFLGETWVSVADTPMGPFAWAEQVVTHDGYSFYNPRHHPEFDEGGGRVVYFEGTYSQTFSGVDTPTPRYDYNQIMYRVDLDRLLLPVPVYGPALRTRAAMRPGDDASAAVFFALHRPTPGAVALRWSGPDCATRELSVDGAGEVAFWAMTEADTTGVRVPLFALPRPGASPLHTLVGPLGATPLGWVWPNPLAAPFPVAAHPGPLRADAGPDQCVEANSATVRGAASDPGAVGVWRWEGGESSGPELTLEGEGVCVLTWEVTTADGRVASDVVVVGLATEPGCGCATLGTRSTRRSLALVAGLALCLAALARRRASGASPA